MILKHIGLYKDLTVQRLLKFDDLSSYDKDSPKERRIIQKLFGIPYFGILFANILKKRKSLQTLSKKLLDKMRLFRHFV